MSRHADLLKLLLPPVAYDKSGSKLSAEVTAVGNRLDVFDAIVESLRFEIDPRTTTFLLPDWERAYGLPDECRGAADTVADRRAMLAAKVAGTGGLSKPYFIGIAAALGYENVTIDKFRPTSCEMSCEDPLTEEEWRTAWRVNIPGQGNIYRQFSAESSCEEPIDSYKQGPLECMFMKLQPADSITLFNYEGS